MAKTRLSFHEEYLLASLSQEMQRKLIETRHTTSSLTLPKKKPLTNLQK